LFIECIQEQTKKKGADSQALKMMNQAFMEIFAQLKESVDAGDAMGGHSLVGRRLDHAVNDLYTAKDILWQGNSRERERELGERRGIECR